MKILYKNYFNIIEKYRNNKLLLLFYISIFVITVIYISVNAKCKLIIENDVLIRIKSGIFENRRNIKHVIIPKGVKVIGREAFDCCFKLESVDIPDTVESIENFAFCNCQSLQTIDIPDTVKNIGITKQN